MIILLMTQNVLLLQPFTIYVISLHLIVVMVVHGSCSNIYRHFGIFFKVVISIETMKADKLKANKFTETMKADKSKEKKLKKRAKNEMVTLAEVIKKYHTKELVDFCVRRKTW